MSASLAAADTGLLLVAFCLLALTIPLAAERWRSSAQAVKVSFSHGFFLHATYVAVFAGQFLPAGIGVDAARLGFLWHRKVLLRLAFHSVLIDRLVGLAAICLLMFGGIPFVVRALPESAVVPVIGLAATLLVVCAGQQKKLTKARHIRWQACLPPPRRDGLGVFPQKERLRYRLPRFWGFFNPGDTLIAVRLPTVHVSLDHFVLRGVSSANRPRL